MIRKAQLADLTTVYDLTQACAQAMIANDIYQWNEHYPTLERFQKDIELQELYMLEENETFYGIVVLTTIIDEEYVPVKWLTENDRNLYIHRLAVHPKYWGDGYAQRLMDFAEQYARNKECTSLRLDTFSQNKRNQKFYEMRGYKRLEEIYLPKQSLHPFYCYELIL